jgi:hypothetical protein
MSLIFGSIPNRASLTNRRLRSLDNAPQMSLLVFRGLVQLQIRRLNEKFLKSNVTIIMSQLLKF